MRLLWIPHTRWSSGVGHRTQYLVERLKRKHEIHVITWSEPKTPSPWAFANPKVHVEALIPWNIADHGITLHHVPRWCFHRSHTLWKSNERRLQRLVRSIVRDYGIETIVFGPSAYLIGYPPTDTGASLLFDYVDRLPDEVLKNYLARADAITCVSNRLVMQVASMKRDSTHIPNGVDIDKVRQADGSQIRARYQIQERLVISLIGLTCSPDLYFVRSLLRIRDRIPNSTFLFVGKGPMYGPLRKALITLHERGIWTGWIPPDRIHDFFMASDIGLYPGANDEYFRSACPIKLLEYAASRKPSVSSPVDEIDVLGLKSVVQVDATSEAFTDGIERALSWTALDDPARIPSWEALAHTFESVISGHY